MFEHLANELVEYSRGSGKFDNAPAQITASDFDSFEVAILADRAPHKGLAYICAPLQQGPHYKRPAKYLGEQHWRLQKYVLPRSFLAFDFDGFADEASYHAMLSYLACYRGLGYTTASHTVAAPRARAILKLSRKASREECIDLGRILQAAMLKALGTTSVKFDSSVYRGEQPVYTPVTNSETFHFSGGAVNVDALLTADVTKAATSRERRKRGVSGPDCLLGHLLHHTPAATPRAIAVLNNQLAFISADCSYDIYRNIIWAILSTEWSCREEMALAWSLTAPERYDETCFQNLIACHDSTLADRPTLGTIYYHARLGGWNE